MPIPSGTVRGAGFAAVVFAAALLVAPALAAGEIAIPGGNLALCVGVDAYAHLAELDGPTEDALAIGRAFGKTGDFRKIVVLADRDEKGVPPKPRFLPTRANVVNALRLLANNAVGGGGIVVFFGGHGMIEDGVPYLMPSDAEGDPAGAIALSEVIELLDNSRAARKVLLLDACRSEEMFPGLAGGIVPPGSGVTVIVSCDEGQTSLIDEAEGRGVFSLALERALTGEGDADQDGLFRASELYQSLELSMSGYCLDNMVVQGQTPVLIDGGGDIVVLAGYAEAEPASASVAAAKTRDEAETEGDAAPAATPPADAETLRAALADADKLRDDGKDASAFVAYLPLAEKGMTEAESRVGHAYYFGNGVSQSYELAAEWLLKAGAKGDAAAQELLGSMYYFGKGVEQDLEQSARWNMMKGKIPEKGEIPGLAGAGGTESADAEATEDFALKVTDEAGTRYYGDAGPSVRLEIIRPDMAPVIVERTQVESSNLSFGYSKTAFAKDERAFIDLRVVGYLPDDGENHVVQVHLKEPEARTLTANVHVKSDKPVYTQVQTTQTQTYTPQQQTYRQSTTSQSQYRQSTQTRQPQQQYQQSDGSGAAQAFGRFARSLLLPF